MASSVNRRELISWMGVGALAPLLGACSALPGQRGGSASVDLLYVADTLDARQPGLPVVPATRLGPVSQLGRAPWMTGASASLAHPRQLAPLLDANQAAGATLAAMRCWVRCWSNCAISRAGQQPDPGERPG